MADELARLVGDTYLDGGDLVVVAYLDGLGAQEVALLGARYEHDAVADAEGELTVIVHQGSDREVGKRKQSPSLTYVTSIEVFCCHSHFCYCMMFVHFCNSAPSVGGEAVCLIQ